jgi:hypothetical protein
MEEAIAESDLLSEDERSDLGADLETIRAQLRKREPNLSLLAGLLESMSRQYPLLAPQVSRLIGLVFV